MMTDFIDLYDGGWINLDNGEYSKEVRGNYEPLRAAAVNRLTAAQIEMIAATQALRIIDDAIIREELQARGFAPYWKSEGMKACFDYSDSPSQPVFIGKAENGRLRIYQATKSGKQSKVNWSSLSPFNIRRGNLRPR